ncbi:MAG: hypothetical protein JWN48_1490 [Myxococcaceae bacterium]|nr:hypothetical protein [Myxococcaceae bacterium]
MQAGRELALPQLMVSFARDRRGRTYVARQRSTHPFHLCRPLYRPGDPEGLASLYVQGCAGGLFEGDRVALSFGVHGGAEAHVTTAAATIVHRMPHGGHAEQDVQLELARGAWLEHFPDPAIMFPRSRLRTKLCVRVAAGARLLAVDSFLAHRLPDDEAPFDWLDSSLRIEDLSGRLLARERFVARGQAFCDGSVGVTAGLGGPRALPCQGTVLALGAGSLPLHALREAWPAQAGLLGGATLLPNELGVLGRVLASDGATLRRALHAAWLAVRAALGIADGGARPK